MKKVTFVTGNQDKAMHLARVLGLEIDHTKLDLEELQSIDLHAIVEHKARQAYEKLNTPVLVDDTSLGLTALNGLPGPFVKFFIPLGNTDILLRIVQGQTDRSAVATVGMGYYDGIEFIYFESSVTGTIAKQPCGKNGYGWDKIFVADNSIKHTNAELNREQYDKYYRKIRSIDRLREFLVSKDSL